MYILKVRGAIGPAKTGENRRNRGKQQAQKCLLFGAHVGPEGPHRAA